MKKSPRVFGQRLVLLALTLLLLTGAAMAEGDSEFIFFANTDVPNPTEIINFKGKLNEYGFYISGISDEDLRSTELDPTTLAAVQQVNVYNPDLAVYTDRVTYELYWRVVGQNTDGKVLNTPAGAVGLYKLIEPGATGPDVGKLQTRLSNLGYGEDNGFSFTPEVFDDELARAIDAFVAANNYYGYYPDVGISPELQELIFQEDPEPARFDPPKQPLPQKILGFFKGSSTIAGFRIPNIALIAVGFVLLCVVVILVMRLVTPSKSKNSIKFRVEYAGTSKDYNLPLGTGIAIGRSVGNFPLNMGDANISRDHALIRRQGDALIFEDHSTNGSTVNGQPCHNSQRPLRSGDVLGIGGHRITVKFKL